MKIATKWMTWYWLSGNNPNSTKKWMPGTPSTGPDGFAACLVNHLNGVSEFNK